MKKLAKKIVAATLLCSMFACTNSFALPKWLEDLPKIHPALKTELNRIKKESPNKELNLGNDFNAACALYWVTHPNKVTSKPINKEDIIDYCEDGIKVFGPSKSAPCGVLFSWIKLSNGKIVYSRIPINIDDGNHK